jgi:nitroreductase
MRLDDVLRQRRSTRRFRTEDVPNAMLSRILDVAISGPSAGNLQAFRVIAVRQPDLRSALQRAAFDQHAVGAAPVVLLLCADEAASSSKYGGRGARLYAVQDATIAGTLAWLKAVDLGLAGVWIGAFDEAEVARVLGLGAGIRPVAMLPLGFGGESPEPLPRKGASDLVTWR